MKKQNKIFVLIILLLLVVFAIFAIYWVNKLQVAHSTFEDYYSFRGCIQLINNTEESGFCKTDSGQVIEIVRYKGKWYLNGDLPGGFFDW
jgi:hypothetical protein